MGSGWTEERKRTLIAFVADGASRYLAAAALKRKAKRARVQARKLGSPFPPINEIRKKWPDTPPSFWRQI